jgi:hypothetical protein
MLISTIKLVITVKKISKKRQLYLVVLVFSSTTGTQFVPGSNVIKISVFDCSKIVTGIVHPYFIFHFLKSMPSMLNITDFLHVKQNVLLTAPNNEIN